MALIKSKLRLPHSLSHSKILRTLSFSSSTLEPTLQEDDTDNYNSKTTPTTTLNPEENLIAEKFNALIKDHHRKNPNLCYRNNLIKKLLTCYRNKTLLMFNFNSIFLY